MIFSSHAVPTGEFAEEILGGLWPTTNGFRWSECADEQSQFAGVITHAADSVQTHCSSLQAHNSGSWLDGMQGMYTRTMRLLTDQSNHYRVASEVTHRCESVLRTVRGRLISILVDARTEIEAAQDFVAAAKAAIPPGPNRQAAIDALETALKIKIEEIVSENRAKAASASTLAAGEIAIAGLRHETAPEIQKSTGTSGPPLPTIRLIGMDRSKASILS